MACPIPTITTMILCRFNNTHARILGAILSADPWVVLGDGLALAEMSLRWMLASLGVVSL